MRRFGSLILVIAAAVLYASIDSLSPPSDDRLSSDRQIESSSGSPALAPSGDNDGQSEGGLIRPATALPVGEAADQALGASLAVPPTNVVKQVTVGRGDTLIKLLRNQSVPQPDAHAVVSALAPVYDLRRLQIGQTFTLTFGPESQGDGGPADAADLGMADAGDRNATGGRDLIELAFRAAVDRDIRVELKDGHGYEATVIERDLERRDAFAAGVIDSSLYEAAVDSGTPIDVLMRLIRIFSFDVDFQRDIQPGDRFAVLYSEEVDDGGVSLRNGEIHYATMTLSGKTLEFVRYTPKSGFTDYFARNGQSVKKTLMRTPVDGARLSSRFGMRKHPILGYSKMHRGIDFAAPRGTPIMAAGDGVIESIGRNGGYGKYIRLRHNGAYKTAYAHMTRYAGGLKRGSRVRQGEIIGYVGSTGRSTGPHLHYEVLVDDRQVNPLSVKLPAGETLQGADLAAFQAILPELDRRVAAARTTIQLASD